MEHKQAYELKPGDAFTINDQLVRVEAVLQQGERTVIAYTARKSNMMRILTKLGSVQLTSFPMYASILIL